VGLPGRLPDPEKKKGSSPAMAKKEKIETVNCDTRICGTT